MTKCAGICNRLLVNLNYRLISRGFNLDTVYNFYFKVSIIATDNNILTNFSGHAVLAEP